MSIIHACADELSVLIATHNRAAVLHQTLIHLTETEQGGIRWGIVVIDNNSTDETAEVIDRFRDRLPLQHLFESAPGKNHALNRALADAKLGELIAFTDDDVQPAPDWLHAMVNAARRWPDHSVFGGRIRVVLPDDAPTWARRPDLKRMMYGLHDRGEEETLYPRGQVFPCGANYWIRRELVASGRRFDASIGPRPKRRYMGSETSFMHGLIRAGHDIVHIPSAVVGHCIQADALTPQYVRQRAWRRGKSSPHATGQLAHAELSARHPVIWRAVRVLSLARWAFRYLLANLSWSSSARVAGSVSPMMGMSRDLESLRLRAKSGAQMRELREAGP